MFRSVINYVMGKIEMNVTSYNVTRRLNVMAKKLNKIPFINSGGCCVVAALVGDALSKIEGVESVSAIIMDSFNHNENPLQEIRKTLPDNSIRSWNSRGVYFGHVIIKYVVGGKVRYYDSRGVKRKLEYGHMEPMKGEMDIADAMHLAMHEDNIHSWNKLFNRDNIPKINKNITKFLQKFGVEPQESLYSN